MDIAWTMKHDDVHSTQESRPVHGFLATCHTHHAWCPVFLHAWLGCLALYPAQVCQQHQSAEIWAYSDVGNIPSHFTKAGRFYLSYGGLLRPLKANHLGALLELACDQ